MQQQINHSELSKYIGQQIYICSYVPNTKLLTCKRNIPPTLVTVTFQYNRISLKIQKNDKYIDDYDIHFFHSEIECSEFYNSQISEHINSLISHKVDYNKKIDSKIDKLKKLISKRDGVGGRNGSESLPIFKEIDNLNFDSPELEFCYYRSFSQNVYDNGNNVKIIHIPTNISSICEEFQVSRLRNKIKALETLKSILKDYYTNNNKDKG